MEPWDWYKLFNLTDFLAKSITSEELVVILESIGRATILVSRGAIVSITYDGVYLPVNFTDDTYIDEEEGYGAKLDTDMNVWLGVKR